MSIRRRRQSSHARSVANHSAVLELLENRLLLSVGNTLDDVPPVLTVTTPAIVRTNADYVLGLSSGDLGNDTISSWTIDWGDGQVQTIAGNPQAATHRYVKAGQYIIAATAEDEDGQYTTVDPDVTVQPGELDPTWGGDGVVTTAFDFSGSCDTVHNFAVQPDGKIVAVGTTMAMDGVTRLALVRMNADGSLDRTFGTAGRVIGQEAWEGGESYRVAIQSDGKILVAGEDNDHLAIMRYNANGTVDQSFGVNGIATANSDIGYSFANGLIVLADGGILSCGTLNDEPAVLCWTSNGQLDPSFSDDGIAPIPYTINADDGYFQLLDLELQPDGNIVVFGQNVSWRSAVDTTLVLARYNTNGSIDTTFGVDGIRVDNFSNVLVGCSDMTIGSDGRIVLAGTEFSRDDTPEDYVPSNFAAIRYDSDGTRDLTFGDGGIVVTDMGFGYGDNAYRAAILPDGKLLVSGDIDPWDYSYRPYAAAVRYNRDGSLDTTFGNQGKVVIDLPGDAPSESYARGLAVLPNGQILLAGRWNNDLAMTRVTRSGILDPTFGRAGYALVDFPTPSPSYATAMVAQPDGKILVAGVAMGVYSSGDVILARYHADGTLDRSFGVDGRVDADWGYSENISAMVLQSDGKIVAVGRLGEPDGGDDTGAPLGWLVVRFNRDGSRDTTFGLDGAQILRAGTLSGARDLVIQPNGKIVVAGSVQTALDEDGYPIVEFALARLNANGSLDTTFGVKGWSVIEDTEYGYGCAYDVALQPDGKIVAVGGSGPYTDFDQDFLVVRLTSTGHRDTSFGSDGVARVDFGQSDSGAARSMAIQPDGRILILASGQTGTRLLCLTKTGQLDTDFGENGSVTDDYCGDLLLQPDGRILLMGGAGVLRYNPDGSPDAEFDLPAASRLWVFSGDLVMDNQGRLLVAGAIDSSGDPYSLDLNLAVVAFGSGYSTVRVVDTLPVMLTSDGAVDEGHTATVSFTGIKSTTGMRFSYDFDNDGVFEIIDSNSPAAVVPGSYLTDVASRTVRATVRGADGRLSDYITSIAVHNLPPTIQSIVINDGAAQRSRILSITVTFDQKIRNWPEAYLRTQGDSSQEFYFCMEPAGWDDSMPEQDGYRTFVYRFSETLDGWLEDGQYNLVFGTWIEDLFDEPMASDAVIPLHKLGGDANGDQAVDVGDLGILGANYGRTGTELPGDMNLDGTVDAGDLSILGANYGQTLPTLPAPGAILPLATAADIPAPDAYGGSTLSGATIVGARDWLGTATMEDLAISGNRVSDVPNLRAGWIGANDDAPAYLPRLNLAACSLTSASMAGVALLDALALLEPALGCEGIDS